MASRYPGEKFGSSRKLVGCTSLYTKFRCVTAATIAFATVLFTAKPYRVMKSYMPNSLVPKLFGSSTRQALSKKGVRTGPTAFCQ